MLALHGGTYDSAYYDTGDGSLLDVGAALGLRVIALDRPGYGAGTQMDPSRFSFAGQTALLIEAINTFRREIQPVNGAVLIGHSIGGMIALHVAAARGVDLLGVEVAGIGARWQPGMLEMWTSFIGDASALEVPAGPHAQVMFGPTGTYTQEQHDLDAELIRPMPMAELPDVVRWADEFAGVAAAVTIPVNVTFAEHDNIWHSDEPARSLARDLFTHTQPAEVRLLAGAGPGTAPNCTSLVVATAFANLPSSRIASPVPSEGGPLPVDA